MKLCLKNCISVVSFLAAASNGFNNVAAEETALTDCESIVGQSKPCVDVTADDNKAVVIGKSVENTYGNQVDVFLGIKYATQERFEPSELLLTEGVVEAEEKGPACAQPPSAWFGGSIEEDCLYLNIWRPESDDEQELLPVMFWIHGGGFLFGSGNDANFDGANLAGNEKVVVVTINYRLNIFGYLPTGSDHGTGGMNGILDQIRALEWVQKHISSFGGDPDKVTIFGESAGAISACQLSVIPQAKELFLRAIMESGFCGFVPFHEESLSPALESIGCAEPCDIEDLKEKSAEELLPANAKHGFQPIHDNDVVPAANPTDLYSESSNINPTDMIIGYNTFDDYETFFLPLEDYIKGANFEEASQLSYVSEDVKNNILTHYSPAKYNDSSLAAYAQFRGDSDFGCPSRFLAPTAASSISGKVYLYLFATLSDFDYSKASGLLEEANIDDLTWSSHEAEIPFVFGNTIELGGKPNVTYPSSFTDQEMVLVKEMMSRWAGFARTGDPQATPSVKWIPVSDVGNATDPAYMNFGSNGGTMVDSDKEKSDQCVAMLGVYGSHSEAPTTNKSTKLCIGNRNEFTTAYGSCSIYFGSDLTYCDYYMNGTYYTGNDVCSECGECSDLQSQRPSSNEVPTPSPTFVSSCEKDNGKKIKYLGDKYSCKQLNKTRRKYRKRICKRVKRAKKLCPVICKYKN